MAIDYQDLSSINYYTFKNSTTIKQMVVRILPVLHFPIYKSGFTLLVKAGVDIIKQKLDINSRGDYYSSFAIPSIHTVKWITHLNRSSIFLTPEVGLGLSYQFPNSYHWSLQLQWLHAFSLNQYYNFNDPTQADTVLQPSNHSIKVKKY